MILMIYTSYQDRQSMKKITIRILFLQTNEIIKMDLFKTTGKSSFALTSESFSLLIDTLIANIYIYIYIYEYILESCIYIIYNIYNIILYNIYIFFTPVVHLRRMYSNLSMLERFLRIKC